MSHFVNTIHVEHHLCHHRRYATPGMYGVINDNRVTILGSNLF